MGGKWLCYFPPLIVRSISYAEIVYVTGTPHGSTLNPLGWWGFYVILAMEAAGIGGIIGEVMIKNVYGRTKMVNAPAEKRSVAEKEIMNAGVEQENCSESGRTTSKKAHS